MIDNQPVKSMQEVVSNLPTEAFRTVQFNRTRAEDAPFMGLAHAWWQEHRWIQIPEVLFSDYGFCSFVGHKPVFISFLYPVIGSKTCMWGYQVTNPDSSSDERSLAFEDAATAVCDFARELGYKVLMAYPGNKAILERLKKIDFKPGDTRVIQALKEL